MAEQDFTTADNLPLPTSDRFRKWLKPVFVTLAIIAFVAMLPFYLIFWVHPVQNVAIGLFGQSGTLQADTIAYDADELYATLEKTLVRNRTKLNSFVPKHPFIVINITENKFWLYNAKMELVREGVCSTGSYITLDNGKKTWTFKTPKGVRKIINKVKDPVWTKPDWAFIEEGLPVPSARHESRYEYGVLGDYALHIGDGYMLHGTIYQRFLGQAVTHGCIRLGDKDLEAIYKTLVIGSKVFVY
ncbi:L,D-transpeptidase YbiS [Breznakibacter xylanolyticus]|uniref:L,D-transpeptidase YbiS n=1 Tax=Breznakibacter xylanolyticus TaxID=990 RepID=A0A2W7MY52_9BACT|nr:L,D-transpeptidase [Breznakibacter xylanolyticus]MBN2744793.1 L,D-transpeptidase [Marinilabiliaceae bacterium]PZX12938.1 L,D-transpeptidase YbiS [Breznakibacter xylanolyticus]